MTITKLTANLAGISLASALLAFAADDVGAAKQAKKPTPATRSAQAEGLLDKSDSSPSAGLISYSARDVVKLKTKIRYTTLIVLPKDEQILDITCGDKELWVVNATQNMAYVKPAKVGAQTNLNLITASGNIYSFIVTEISESASAQPDLKVFVELKEAAMIAATTGLPKFVPTESLEECRRQVEQAKADVTRVKQESQSAIDSGISRFVANVRFPYRFEAGKKPFNVRAMYHDDKLTYIQARPEEVPTLYEMKDGKPSLVNFDYRNGAYVATKILDRGYLAIGKQKLLFTREE